MVKTGAYHLFNSITPSYLRGLPYKLGTVEFWDIIAFLSRQPIKKQKITTIQEWLAYFNEGLTLQAHRMLLSYYSTRNFPCELNQPLLLLLQTNLINNTLARKIQLAIIQAQLERQGIYINNIFSLEDLVNPDEPGLTHPDEPGLTHPDEPGLTHPDEPGLTHQDELMINFFQYSVFTFTYLKSFQLNLESIKRKIRAFLFLFYHQCRTLHFFLSDNSQELIITTAPVGLSLQWLVNSLSLFFNYHMEDSEHQWRERVVDLILVQLLQRIKSGLNKKEYALVKEKGEYRFLRDCACRCNFNLALMTSMIKLRYQ